MCLRQLAEYRDRYAELTALNAEVVGISADTPEEAAALQLELGLPFPLVTDRSRRALRAWGLLNTRERGGIAVPACYVLAPDGRVRFASTDRWGARVGPEEVLRVLRSGVEALSHAEPRRRTLLPNAREWYISARNYLGIRPAGRRRPPD
jgi:peroxiredoxin